MTHIRCPISAVLLLLGAAQAHAAACDNSTAIWANDGPDGVRHVIYRVYGNPDAPSNISAFGAWFIEEWRGRTLAWRTAAEMTCSNGHSTCYVFVKIADDDSEADASQDEVENPDAAAEGDTTETILERIDENDDGLSEWVILAGLGQELHYAGGAKVEWYNGFKPEESERQTAPNIYKFAGCRTAPVLPEQSSLFVDPAVCPYYRKTGSLDPGDDFTPYPGTIVWMKGNQIGGGNLKCDIRSFNDGLTITADCSGKAATEQPKATEFRFSYEWDRVILSFQQLDLCVR